MGAPDTGTANEQFVKQPWIKTFITKLIVRSSCFRHHCAHHQELKSYTDTNTRKLSKQVLQSNKQSGASSWPFIFHVLTTMHGQTHIKEALDRILWTTCFGKG
jgi:hypothetical protein